MEHTGKAKIVQHCAVFGPLATEVRWVSTGDVGPYAQYTHGLNISFIRPGKRTKMVYGVMNDNMRYVTIEVAGKVIYDSRSEIPCDMDKWNETAAAIKARNIGPLMTNVGLH